MSRSQIIEYRGQIHTIADWSKITGLSRETIRRRLKNGWTIQEALDTPPIPRGCGRYYMPMNKGCEGCYYWRLLHYSNGGEYHPRYCAYILATGHRRPCPAAHCTEYRPARRGQKGRK